MDTNFWLEKWQNNNIGFHRSEANPVLIKYFSELSLRQGSRVFLPLCGKTLDIAWLLSHGYRVAGAELVEMAIEQLFVELEVEPTIVEVGNLKQYSAENLDIFVGDIFELSGEMLGSVEATYDRAALVALPEEMRNRYTAHLMEITDKAPQLLVTYEYEQNLMAGPPFSISSEEVNQHYGDNYDLTLIVSNNVPGGFKGKCAATENVWLLQNDFTEKF
ncbi:MAG: thiopurine S-methyltransferase [Symploca sp. SIO2D2]|nr:thiopurine S-methyltransferase [Symploca sp. SIO2D2]